MRQITLFIRMSIIVFRGLYSWLDPPAYIIIKFIFPFFQMCFFVFLAKFTLGPDKLAYVAIGNAVQFVGLNTLMGVAIALAGEKWFGTLPMLLTSPANRLLIFSTRAAVQVLDGVIAAVIGLMFAGLFFGVSFAQADLLSLAVALFLSSLTLTGFGLAIASLSLFTRHVDPIMNAAYLLVFLLAGVNFPIEQLPMGLRVFSYIIPLTYGLDAARQAIAGIPLTQLGNQIVMMLGLFLIEGALGYWILLRFEGLAKRYGTLEMV